MKDLLFGIARFVPAYLETLLHLTIKPYSTIVRLARDSNVQNACFYFFLCVVLTQLFRFRLFSDPELITKIGVIDLGWKLPAAVLFTIYLWGVTSISTREPDLTRLVIFVAYAFGTLSVVFQSVLILLFGSPVSTPLSEPPGKDSVLKECLTQAGGYSSARIVDTPRCRELAQHYPEFFSKFTDPFGREADLLLAIAFALLVFAPLLIAWSYRMLRAYMVVFLSEKRRYLALFVLITLSPLIAYLMLRLRETFLSTVFKA